MAALFQDDAEGAYAGYSYFASGLAKSYSIQDFRDDNGIYTFVAPSGHPISLRGDAKNLQFETKLTCLECPTNQSELSIAKGVLTYFELGNKSFYAKVSNGIFIGYVDGFGGSANFHEDNISKEKNKGHINIVINDSKEFFDCEISLGNYEDKYFAEGGVVSSISNSCIKSPEYKEATDLFAVELQKLINDNNKFTKAHFQGGFKSADWDSRFKAFEMETGSRIFLLQQPVEIQLQDKDKEEFLDDVISKVNGFNNDKDILICVPYNSSTSNNSPPQFSNWFIRGLNEQLEINSQLALDFGGQLRNIYKQIPKPYYEIGYFVSYGGDIFQLTGIKNERVTGYEHIYDFKLVIDQRFDDYAKAFNDVYKSKPDPNNQSHKNEHYIRAYYNKVQNLETFIDRHAETGDALLDHGLKEHFLKPNSNGRSVVAHQYVNAFVQYELREFYKGDRGSFPGNDKFISGSAPDYINPHDIVLNVLDVASLVLSFADLDVFPEALGAVYAGVVGRYDEMETRLIGTAVAVGTAAVVLRQFNKIKTGKARYKAADEIVEVVQGAGDDLLNAFKPGYTKESILAIPKGSRPNPSTYLKEEYITNHLAKFENEGIVSRIVSKNDYNNYGIGKPDAGKTEFVGLKSEIDDILSLPLSEQATKLGIPIDQLQNGELVRIDFKLSSTYKVEMPSGNEFGANSQWLPGGKLPTSLNEAVIKTEGMQLNIDYLYPSDKSHISIEHYSA